MWMATRSNSGFRHEESLSSMMSRHAINFQSNTSSEMIQMGPYFGRSGALLGMNMINNVASSGLIQTGNCSNDSVSGLKLDTSLASEWSTEEQFKLEDGLEKYKDKPSIMKYIKIAATLPDKTVRDVALRCRWMTRKRRKAEELYCGKRTSSSKDKQAELSSSIPSVLPDNMASYPFLMPFTSSSKHITCEDLSGHAISLLEQNVRAFSQIRANLSSYKVQDNIDLFCQTRNNLITIQTDMNNMPGLMSQMPPLPIAINDDLSATILSNSTLAMPFNTMQSGSFHMKQEPLG
ncbi:hypothetical protein EUTSA_v10018953mg [Eutrema salsugineum]|uniref:Myb-like domain-containing protein n=1 Tax=Eutrema salsugineum TaxID=72664 RepID=V4KBG5_EUTSA|nr:uncharacterized protein LOC18008343 [Eutrema salsugineum]ESQ28464.1 hypothetical protein EUTSA_v10018953mg [Eutrema salsugineum]